MNRQHSKQIVKHKDSLIIHLSAYLSNYLCISISVSFYLSICLGMCTCPPASLHMYVHACGDALTFRCQDEAEVCSRLSRWEPMLGSRCSRHDSDAARPPYLPNHKPYSLQPKT